MHLRLRLLFLLIVFLSVQALAKAQQRIAAVVEITYQGVALQRANTEVWLPLPVGAQAPFGIGDTLRTDKTGRALLTFGEAAETLLLPNSEYHLDTLEQTDNEQLTLSVRLITGRSIQHILDASQLASYQLNLQHMTLQQPTLLFATQVERDFASDVIIAQGSVELSQNGSTMTLQAGSGLRAADTLGEIISITPPQGFSFLAVTSATCRAIINATIPGETSVAVRLGPGEGYLNLGIIPNDTQVAILGKTDDGFRYLTPYLSSFGWLIANGIILQSCDNIPIVPAAAQVINGVTNPQSFEMDLLVPFFGTPSQNIRFYNYE